MAAKGRSKASPPSRRHPEPDELGGLVVARAASLLDKLDKAIAALDPKTCEPLDIVRGLKLGLDIALAEPKLTKAIKQDSVTAKLAGLKLLRG